VATHRIQRSIATVSWIDPAAGLPEAASDQNKPKGSTTTRAFLTGSKGYRFCNFMEVWADWDPSLKRFTEGGFTAASELYRGPSYMGIDSYAFAVKKEKKSEEQSLTFTQIAGARTVSPEVMGGFIGGGLSAATFPFLFLGPIGTYLAGRYVGRAAAHALTAFPPIWSMLSIEFAVNDKGGPISRGSLRTHSYFPSLTFYKVIEYSPADVPPGLGTQTDDYLRYAVPSGADYYNAVPSLDLWKDHGWGPVRSWNTVPTGGNPWALDK
jgi:hypothetical protein